MDGIETAFPPAAHQIVSLRGPVEETTDVRWRELSIRIHHDYIASTRVAQSCADRSAETAVRRVPDYLKVWETIPILQAGCVGRVCTPVIDNHNIKSILIQRLCCAPQLI